MIWDLETELDRLSGGELSWVARRGELVFRPLGGPAAEHATLEVPERALRNHLQALLLAEDDASGGSVHEAAVRALVRRCRDDAWHQLDPFARLRRLEQSSRTAVPGRWRRTPSGADRLQATARPTASAAAGRV